MKKKFSNQELSVFSGQLAMLLHAGISAVEGVSILYEDASDAYEKQILETVSLTLQETGELATSLSASGAFPAYMIHMADIGERSGTLDEVLDSLASHYEREDAISRSIRDAITYPMIMVGMLLAVLAVLIVKVMPVFRQVFQQLGLELSGTANAFYLLGQNIRRCSSVLLFLIPAVFAAVLLAYRLPKGRIRLLALIRRIPAFQKISFLLACSRFSGAMSRALRSGLDPDESFHLASELIEQPELKERVKLAEKEIQEGESFADALNRTGIYSGLNARMISTGFRTGSPDLALEKISVRCQEEADTRIQNLVNALEPAIVAVLSVLTGMVLLSVMLPLLGVLSGIG